MSSTNVKGNRVDTQIAYKSHRNDRVLSVTDVPWLANKLKDKDGYTERCLEGRDTWSQPPRVVLVVTGEAAGGVLVGRRSKDG